MGVSLRPVTRENVRACINLKVEPGQENFVAPNDYSIAEALAEPDLSPLAICDGDAVVGFAMYGQDPDTDRWWIIRFMIDADHQGKGIGTAALRALVELIAERHGCAELFLSYVPGNAVAERLYARVGFVPTGELEGDEIVARLDRPGHAERAAGTA